MSTAVLEQARIVCEDKIKVLAPLVGKAASAVEQKKTALKHAKDHHDDLLNEQSQLCNELADILNGVWQPQLPFGEDKLVDNGALQQISALGMSDKETEVLVQHDIKTVGDLEQKMRDDEWWHKKIKGFGESKVTKLTDKLLEFRQANPIPSEDEGDDSETDDEGGEEE